MSPIAKLQFGMLAVSGEDLGRRAEETGEDAAGVGSVAQVELDKMFIDRSTEVDICEA